MILINRKVYKETFVQKDGVCVRCESPIKSGTMAYKAKNRPTTKLKGRGDRICRACGLDFIPRDDVDLVGVQKIPVAHGGAINKYRKKD